MIYSSTSINLASKNCAHALDHLARCTPYDRDVYQVGIAAHAILQAVANWRVANPEELDVPNVAIAEEQVLGLIKDGRSYRGKKEPPMPHESAWEGHRIALDYLAENPVPIGLPEVEVKGEVDGFKVAALLDLVYTSYDLDTGETFLVVRDMKSAWPTGAEELDTIQRKLQGVLAWENRAALAVKLDPLYDPAKDGEAFDALRLEVINLRTGAVFSREMREPVLGEYLDDWKRHISTTIRGLEDAKVRCADCWALGKKAIGAGKCSECRGLGYTRAANPGPRCMGCPYVLRCSAARGWYEDDSAEPLAFVRDPAELAKTYSLVAAFRDDLAKYARAATKEQPIKVEGGEVGYRRADKTVSKPGHAETVVDKWLSRLPSGQWSRDAVVGLVEACWVTGGGLKKVAATLWPERTKESMERRARWVATVTEAKPGREFKCWKT